jgi:hypothetical protein
MSACQSRARRAAARSSANRYSHRSRVTVSELIILGSPFEFAICLDRLYLAACCCVPALPGFIEPCLPTSASGPGWIHEIKHDGYRLMARRDAAGVQLLTHNGIDWSFRFPLIVQAVGALRADRRRGGLLR